MTKPRTCSLDQVQATKPRWQPVMTGIYMPVKVEFPTDGCRLALDEVWTQRMLADDFRSLSAELRITWHAFDSIPPQRHTFASWIGTPRFLGVAF